MRVFACWVQLLPKDKQPKLRGLKGGELCGGILPIVYVVACHHRQQVKEGEVQV